ncbi:MAG: sulfatase [Planctomycetota bacterium]
MVAVGLVLFLSACRQSEQPGSAATAKPGLEDKPNVVLITLDTLRADHLGCYGYGPARTPNIDRFAASAVRFELAVTVSNNTFPSHAAMLIGKHPQSFGVPRNGFKLPPGNATLATILKSQGYETAAFVSASVLESSMGLAPGFDVYDQAFDTREIDQVQRRASATTPAVMAWLKQRGAKPFFLWLHYFDPHYPYTPPAPYDDLFYPEYEGPADGSIEYLSGVAGVRGFPKHETSPEDFRRLVALYDGEIAFLDANLGPVFDLLAEEHHRQRTVVVVVADHGESLTEHDYYFDHGEFTYQPSMHVPLIIRPLGYDAQKGSGVAAEQVETIDIFTTVLAQVGLPVPAGTEGRDLTPLCRGEAGWVRKLCFGEGCRPWGVERMNPGAWANLGKCQFALDFPWKLILTPYKRAAELYRLDLDPGELHNVAREEGDVTRRLAEEAERWRQRAIQAPGVQDPANMRKLRSLGYVGDDP